MSQSTVHNEAITLLAEECSDVIGVATKILRFGSGSEWDGVTNIAKLEKEIGDLMATIDVLLELNAINIETINKAKQDKFLRLSKWSSVMSVEGPDGLLKKALENSKNA